jgi:NhaP-type Na+/H+ or K+/H+ antiporter
MESNSISGGILVLLLILFLAIIGGNALRQKKINYMQEAGLSIILGVLFGFVLDIIGETPQIKALTMLNSEFILFVLLPPIIFQSGYNIDKQLFFGNFGAIITYAFIGTVISTIIISWGSFLISEFQITPWSYSLNESFAFGVIISSTDPVSLLPLMKRMDVDNSLYNIIFGESLFNGAITISLYKTIIEINQTHSFDASFFTIASRFFLIFCGSFVIGGGIALLISWILKKMPGSSSRMDVEATAIIFGPWISYLISEGLGMNGIVSILFCGIFMSRYTNPNLSSMTQTIICKGYSVISYAAETLVFIFLGMGLFSFNLAYE